MVQERSFNLLEVENFSRKLSKNIFKSELVLLKGDLGSGKTTIIRFLIKYIFLLNKESPPKIIPSPSYPILQSYELKNFIIHHYDFYRINKISEIIEIGFEENIQDNITFIEWPELILPMISNYKYCTINVSILDNDKRKINYY